MEYLTAVVAEVIQGITEVLGQFGYVNGKVVVEDNKIVVKANPRLRLVADLRCDWNNCVIQTEIVATLNGVEYELTKYDSELNGINLFVDLVNNFFVEAEMYKEFGIHTEEPWMWTRYAGGKQDFDFVDLIGRIVRKGGK